jgi:hypothetical protein
MQDAAIPMSGRIWSTRGGKGHYIELEGRDPQVIIAEENKMRDAELAQTVYDLLQPWEKAVHAESLKAKANLEGEIAAHASWERDNERDGDPFSRNPYDDEDRLRKIAEEKAAAAERAKDTLQFVVETFLSKIPDRKEATHVEDANLRKP